MEPVVSVVLPVRNEERMLRPALEHLRQTAVLFPIEIIVVDGQSSDTTRETAGPLADVLIVADRPGRARQMNLGAEKARGELILFLHIDTRVPDQWQEIVRPAFLENKNPPAAGAFQLAFDSDKPVYKFIAALAKLRTKFTRVPQGDQCLLVRRELFFDAGGFPDEPILEEYLLLPKLKTKGSVRIFEECAVTSARKYKEKGPVRNALKNSLIVLLFYCGLKPRQLAKWY